MRGMHKIAGSRPVCTFLKEGKELYVRVCTCMNLYILACTGLYVNEIRTYQYILVCTGTYSYVLVHTSTYWNVLVRTSTSISMAALFCGRHDMVQGSTYHIMKCHDIVHTDRYRLKPICTNQGQV